MTKRFTSEDLLKAMGLKVGQKVLIPVYDNTEFIITKDCLKNEFCSDLSISVLVDEDFTIIQPKPTLTEDEMVILRNLPDYCNKYLVRDINNDLSCCGGKPIKQENVWILDTEYRCFIPYEHLFEFIKPMECYSREELLGE